MRVHAKPFCLLLLGALLALAQRPTAPTTGDFEWRVKLPKDQVAKSFVEATNHCFKRHRFQVEPESLPFMRLLGPATFSVNPGTQHRIPAEFDTRNMKPGQYEALVVVKCLTCRREKGCTEDHENLHVFLTVTVPPPNWSKVHPEQKASVSQSPTLQWSVAPEQKPPKP